MILLTEYLNKHNEYKYKMYDGCVYVWEGLSTEVEKAKGD